MNWLAVGGPHFDELTIGQVFDDAPSLTLTPGLASAHQAIVGGRLRLALDTRLSAAVAGGDAPIASPGLVWDVAIGQSTLVTQRVIANLFYRGLRLLRAPRIGDTLTTTTTIAGLKPLSPRPDRPPRGIAVLHIRTVDQDGRAVLDFHRGAMLPARGPIGPDASGQIDPPDPPLDVAALDAATAGWRLDAMQQGSMSEAGTTIEIAGGDVVSSAPELARLTLNLAAVHHDRLAAGGTRLVYGGHTIGIALAQLTRAFSNFATVVAWHGCDHLAPVREGDTLFSTVTVEKVEARPGGAHFAHLRSQVAAVDAAGARTDVLDWRPVALLP